MFFRLIPGNQPQIPNTLNDSTPFCSNQVAIFPYINKQSVEYAPFFYAIISLVIAIFPSLTYCNLARVFYFWLRNSVFLGAPTASLEGEGFPPLTAFFSGRPFDAEKIEDWKDILKKKCCQ